MSLWSKLRARLADEGPEGSGSASEEPIRRAPDTTTAANAEVEPGSAEEVERSRAVAEDVVESHDDADLPPGSPPIDPGTTTAPTDPPDQEPPPRRDDDR